jgi:hypothetical protein
MERDEFRFHLQNLATGGGPEQNASGEALMGFSSRAILLFLSHCAAVLDDPPSDAVCLICLSAIRECLRPKLGSPIRQIRSVWLLPENSAVCTHVKAAVLSHLDSTTDSVRNVAAVTVAQIRLIERHDWPDLLPTLVAQLGHPDSSPHCRVGSITCLHELFVLGVTFPPSELSEFLELLTGFLSSPDIPPYFLKLSSRCLFDLVHCVAPLFRDDSRIYAILDLFPVIMPRADLELYGQMHELLLEIVRQFYQRIPPFMEIIFDIIATGMRAPHVEFALISVDFWAELCELERRLSESIHICYEALASVVPVILAMLAVPFEPVLEIGEVEKTTLRVLESFSTSYPIEMIENSRGFISEGLASSDWIVVHSCFYLIYGLLAAGQAVCGLVDEFLPKILEMVHSYPIKRIVWEGLLLLRRIVKTCVSDECSGVVAASVFDLLNGANETEIVKTGLRLLRSCIDSLKRETVNEKFGQVFELVTGFLENPAVDSDECIEASMSVLKGLVKRDDKRDLTNIGRLLESFVFPGLTKMLSLFEESSQHVDQRLLETVDLLAVTIENIEREIGPFVPRICEICFVCLGYHQAMLFAEVLPIFALLCHFAQVEMREYRDALLRVVHDGLISGSPEVTAESALLFADLCKELNCPPATEPLDDIFELFQYADDGQFQKVLPKLLRAAVVALEQDSEMLAERMDFLSSLVDKQMSLPINVDDVDDLERACNGFHACLVAYTAFFNIVEINWSDREMVKLYRHRAGGMLRRIAKLAKDTRAFNGMFIEALYEYMQSIAQKLRGEIVSDLNNANVKSVLKAGMKFVGSAKTSAEKALKFAAEFDPSKPIDRRPP